jgi:hypothetical protein
MHKKGEVYAREAADLISDSREEQHGNKHSNFENIAILWNAWLRLIDYRELTPSDVATLMSLMKKARTETGLFNEDDFVDDVGYTAIAGELAGAQNELDEKASSSYLNAIRRPPQSG